MFTRIVNFVRDIRIKWDFPQYEKKCRIEHERLAENFFSTKVLEGEKHEILSKIHSEADSLFKDKINKKEKAVSDIKSVITGIEKNLSYFTRYYKRELDNFYERKKQLIEKKREAHLKQKEINIELSDAFKEKDSAYENLNYYKGCIDSWYAKSERTGWLFGNKGKKLPKHSLFSQSFGDLDSYKYDRDKAYDDVVSCKKIIGDLKSDQKHTDDIIANLKNDIGDLINKINKTKKDRSHMYDLQKNGLSKKSLQTELAENVSILKLEQSKLNELQSQRREFVDDKKIKNGVIDLDVTSRFILY